MSDADVRVVEEGAIEPSRADEAWHRPLVENIAIGFCAIELLFEGERAVDCRSIETAPAAEVETGMAAADGRTTREPVPRLEECWFEIYGRVALSREPARFDGRARRFDVHRLRGGNQADHRVAIALHAHHRAPAERTRSCGLRGPLPPHGRRGSPDRVDHRWRRPPRGRALLKADGIGLDLALLVKPFREDERADSLRTPPATAADTATE